MSHVSVMILTTVSNVDAIGKPLIVNAFGESAQESAKIERAMPRQEPCRMPRSTLLGPPDPP
jgi:hypothetical protein